MLVATEINSHVAHTCHVYAKRVQTHTFHICAIQSANTPVVDRGTTAQHHPSQRSTRTHARRSLSPAFRASHLATQTHTLAHTRAIESPELRRQRGHSTHPSSLWLMLPAFGASKHTNAVREYALVRFAARMYLFFVVRDSRLCLRSRSCVAICANG